jgi:hypothetical protein
MKLDFKEIISSWYSVVKHTTEQKELADKRFEICLLCPSKQEILEGKEWSLKCGECGCPLKAKVYSPKTYLIEDGSCPLNKWKDVEIEYLNKINRKQTKTII